jgi:hypothetical protein
MDHLAVLLELCQKLADCGYTRLRYKVVPHIFQRLPLDEDTYCFLLLDGHRYRCDLSAFVDLREPRRYHTLRRRRLRRAGAADLIVGYDEDLEPLWRVVSDNLAERHGARPVHSLQDIMELRARFPDNIKVITAQRQGQILAGSVLFVTPGVVHTQYLASSRAGRELSALDAVIDFAINRATEDGKSYFDFGTSNEEGGRKLNEGLYGYKLSFGAASCAHEFYELDLTKVAAQAR